MIYLLDTNAWIGHLRQNRLVARTLETAWEEALKAEAGVREEFDHWQRTAPQP